MAVQLLNIDCMEYMATLPDKAFDIAIVDPPYGIGEDGRSHLGRIFKKNGTPLKKIDKRNGSIIKVKPQSYKLSSRYDEDQPDQQYFNELHRVSKKQVIWGENYLLFDQKRLSSGRIVWDKVNGNSDQSDCEIAYTNLFNSVRIFSYMWSGMLQGKSITEGTVSNGNIKLKEKRIHPNHKPVALYAWLIKNYCKPGWKILDTHLGSGSSAIAAEKLGFDFVGCEIDKDYYDSALARFKKETDKGLFAGLEM